MFFLPFPRRAGVLLAAGFVTAFSSFTQAREAVVVTATRTAQSADQALAPMVLIEREELERLQAADLGEVLRLHAGLDIGRNGGPGQATSLFMRGTDSNHTLVMIDGVRMNPATIGGAAIHNLDPELIERIEVVKGPRSSLYGSDAIGGVINIITRRAAQGAQADASASAGSHGSNRFAAGWSLADGDFRYGLRASVYDSDGYAPLTASPIEAGHERVSLDAHAGGRIGALDVELSHVRVSGNTEYVDSFTLALLDQDFLNTVTALRLEATPGSTWVTRLRLSEIRDEIDQNQGVDFAHTQRFAVDWQNDVQLGRAQLLTAGIELMREEADVVSFGSGFDEERDIAAVYLQDAIELGAHRGQLAARHTDYEGFGSHVTWDAQYGYLLTEATRITAAVGTAFRAPDQTDRFGFGGNPDLAPEESRNVEFGLRHRFAPAHGVALQVFQNDIDNLIEFDFIGTGGMTNLGEARIRGVELGYDWASGPWRLISAATLQDPQLRSGGQLPRRAKRSLTLGIVHDAKRWQLGADLLATSSRRDSGFSDVILGGYTLLNASALLRLGDDWTLRGRIENLFDRDYALADGFRTGGREARIELAWRYGAGTR
ncbi:MAG: TonB-dependent receptor [Gammaproteobacteria bacterium]|jgi:vitamin B12 transporter|nr:TonB-dependent receptor [Gammaproteobacteria bacterium]